MSVVVLSPGHNVPLKRYKVLISKLEQRIPDVTIITLNEFEQIKEVNMALFHKLCTLFSIIAHSSGVYKSLLFVIENNLDPRFIFSLDGCYTQKDLLKTHELESLEGQCLQAEMLNVDYGRISHIVSTKVILFRYIRDLHHVDNESDRKTAMYKNKAAMEDNEYRDIYFYMDSCGHQAQDNSKIASSIISHLVPNVKE
jgi:hypothetical protein